MFSHLKRLRAALLVFLFFTASSHAALDGGAVLDEVIRRGDALAADYDPARALSFASEFSALYFEKFEQLELDLGVRSASLKSELEIAFGALNGNAMRGAPKERVAASWETLRDGLTRARALYGREDGAGAIFFKSLMILLREGVEAILVIGALAAWLRRSGAADKVWVIYAGAALAIPLSVLTGWALSRSLQGMGAPRAAVEGVVLFMASAMLLYVSCWFFSRREAKRWEEWIAKQMDSALNKGSLLALFGTACFSVYREGAETVLFYQALALTIRENVPERQIAFWSGLAVSVALLFAAYFLLRHAALKLPFKFFFGTTSALLYILAVIFLGQAIIELQAAGWIASIVLTGFPSVNWLGIAPSAQSLGAQALLLLLPALWFSARRFVKPRCLSASTQGESA
ncbi:MAG: FTR1 family protein [Zoogloeaceae bacterium]|jgi:high-affinity iron transporter|nr:FTR1 family protein [Zoogloeaceae bacterium]